MWPFKRKSTSNGKAVPKEVQQYYASEKRERVALAWLIAFVTLVLTIAVFTGIFFGGRWLWRKGHKTSSVATTQKTTKTHSATSSTSTTKPSSPAKNNSAASSPTGNKRSTGASSYTPGTSTPAATQPSSTANTAPRTATPSAPTQPASSKMTNTGPGQTIGIFIAASLLGALGYEFYSRKRLVDV